MTAPTAAQLVSWGMDPEAFAAAQLLRAALADLVARRARVQVTPKDGSRSFVGTVVGLRGAAVVVEYTCRRFNCLPSTLTVLN